MSQKINLNIKKNNNFYVLYTYKVNNIPVDFTNYTIVGKMTTADESTEVATFNVSLAHNGRLILDLQQSVVDTLSTVEVYKYKVTLTDINSNTDMPFYGDVLVYNDYMTVDQKADYDYIFALSSVYEQTAILEALVAASIANAEEAKEITENALEIVGEIIEITAEARDAANTARLYRDQANVLMNQANAHQISANTYRVQANTLMTQANAHQISANTFKNQANASAIAAANSVVQANNLLQDIIAMKAVIDNNIGDTVSLVNEANTYKNQANASAIAAANSAAQANMHLTTTNSYRIQANTFMAQANASAIAAANSAMQANTHANTAFNHQDSANTFKNQANASAVAAAASAVLANTHANTANTYRVQANTLMSQANASAIAAANSASQASGSATAASGSAGAASGSATAAANSASQANTSAFNANTSASLAAGHASSANTSANNANASASAAAGSATAGANSASQAATSASAAANSASQAATSATQAAGNVAAIAGHATTASQASANALTYRNQANASAVAADASAVAADASAMAGANSATQAANSANRANTSATQAAANAVTANTHANTALTYRNQANASAVAAANSATQAAGNVAVIAAHASSANASASAAAGSAGLAGSSAAAANISARNAANSEYWAHEYMGMINDSGNVVIALVNEANTYKNQANASAIAAANSAVSANNSYNNLVGLTSVPVVAGTIPRRDANGAIHVTAGIEESHAVNKGQMDTAIADLPGKVDRSGDTMTGALVTINGTVAAPGLAIGVATSGIYGSSGSINFGVGSGRRGFFNSAQFSTDVPVRVLNGSVAAPAYSFANDTNSGLYWITTDTIGISTAGTESARIDATGNITANGQVRTNTAAPVAVNDLTRKDYVDGLINLQVSKAGDTMTGPLVLPKGNPNTPSLTFTGDTDTGIYNQTTGQLTFGTGGVWRAFVDANELGTSVRVRSVTGTAALPTFSFRDDTNTGMYRPGTDILGFATAGTESLRIDASGIMTANGQVRTTASAPVAANDLVRKDYADNLITPTVLGPNDNLNDVIKSGPYVNLLAGNATANNNYPVNTSGTLDVMVGSVNVRTQIYTQYISNKTFTRVGTGANNWSTWVELANVDSVNTKLTKAGDTMTGQLRISMDHPNIRMEAANGIVLGTLTSSTTSLGAVMLRAHDSANSANYRDFRIRYAENDIAWNNNVIYHAGNFTPANYVLSAGDTMTGPLVFPSGNVTATAISIGGTNTGIYSSAAATINFSTGGVQRGFFNNNQFTSSVPVRIANGSVGSPGYSFSGDTNTGFYWITADTIGVSTAGTESGRIDPNGNWNLTGQVRTNNAAPVAANDLTRKDYVDGIETSVRADLVPNARNIATGNGLTGGGNLSANRTLAVQAGNSLVANTTGIHLHNVINGEKTFDNQVNITSSIFIKPASGANNAHLWFNNSANTEKGLLYTDTGIGAVVIRANGSAAYSFNAGGTFVSPGDITAFSDERLKSDITQIPGEEAMEIVNNISGNRYVKDGRESIGVIAQEIEKVLPELVFESENADDKFKAIGERPTLSVSTGNGLVAVLIETIKYLNNRVDSLEKRIDDIEGNRE